MRRRRKPPAAALLHTRNVGARQAWALWARSSKANQTSKAPEATAASNGCLLVCMCVRGRRSQAGSLVGPDFAWRIKLYILV